MIAAEGLCAGYGGQTVLHGVDLAAASGELVGVLGPNGAGKTTLLLCLAGVLRPQAGSVRLDGDEMWRLAPHERARRVAVVPQSAEPAQGLRLLSLVLMGRMARLPLLGGYGPEDYRVALAAMQAAGVAHLAARPADELSGGERQRALFARALCQETPVLLLDEASAGLDAAARIRMHDLLAARCRAGLTAVAVLHDLNLAALYCSRLVFLKNGRVAHQGLTADVFRRDILMEIYETDVDIVAHPRTGAPQALFAPGAAPPAA